MWEIGGRFEQRAPAAWAFRCGAAGAQALADGRASGWGCGRRAGLPSTTAPGPAGLSDRPVPGAGGLRCRGPTRPGRPPGACAPGSEDESRFFEDSPCVQVPRSQSECDCPAIRPCSYASIRWRPVLTMRRGCSLKNRAGRSSGWLCRYLNGDINPARSLRHLVVDNCPLCECLSGINASIAREFLDYPG